MAIQIRFFAATLLVFTSVLIRNECHARAPQIDFDREVLPVLVSRCLECHNPTDFKGEVDLTKSQTLLDNPQLMAGGKASESLLWQQVEQDLMPPTHPLNASEKAILKGWIEQGGQWGMAESIDRFAYTTENRAGTDWWSFRPISRPPIPVVDANQPAKNQIDNFINDKLKANGLAMASPADRATLLRRLYIDLIGLPPTPEQLNAFLSDADPQAYAKVVDGLLESPHYGERWARHWLDVARYTESQGFEYDRFRSNAWHYRDYVVSSLNADKPYDQFIKEQIAGDVLGFAGKDSKVTSESIVGTSLLVCGPWDQAGSSQANVKQRMTTREEELEDLVSVVGQTFLGITVNCARCHAHKFDPVSQEDYFQFKACFEGVKHGERSIETAEELQARNEQSAQLRTERDQLQIVRNSIEKQAREAVLQQIGSSEKAIASVVPYARWNFEKDASDSIGDLKAELHGGAVIRNGRLILQGESQFAKTAGLKKELKEKTLEAWVVINDRQQKGGGVITVETAMGATFDSIVYGERQSGKWISGSNGFVRTRDLDAKTEDSPENSVIHVAIVYRGDNTITVYRNGTKYAEEYNAGSLAVYPVESSHVLFGLRHTGAGNGFLKAEIDSASLYDIALSDSEIEASFQAGPHGGPVIKRDELMLAMSPDVQKTFSDNGKRIEILNSQIKRLTKPNVSYVGQRQQPEPTHRLVRGDVSQPAEVVNPGALSRIAKLESDFSLSENAPEAERRLKLANWLADESNPLTARVMINRIWHYHFGRGIVETPNDFGFNGARPSHPELLDWLSNEFVRGPNPWSIKYIHRLIVTSATYQQSSSVNSEAVRVDAENSLLWRYTPRRLEGEIVRDCMLAVSGELNAAVGGPSFMPFKITSFNSDFYQPIDPIGVEYNRRTIYRAHVNSGKSAMMDALDCPDPSIKTPARRATTTPIAALALMNNSFVQRQAAKMSDRIAAIGPAREVEYAYQLCFSRLPSVDEKTEAVLFIRENGLESFCWALLNSTEFLYID